MDGIVLDTQIVVVIQSQHVGFVLFVSVVEINCQDNSNGELENKDGMDDNPISHNRRCSFSDLDNEDVDVAQNR